MGFSRGLDDAAFERLYRSCAQDLLVWLLRRTFDLETARDIWAESWAAAYAGRKRFRGNSERAAAGWVYGIAKRKYALYLRRGEAEQKALRRLKLERPDIALSDHELLEELADLDGLRRASIAGLAGLPEDQRAAVELRVLQGLPYETVAGRLHVSEPAARARVSRGLRTLSSILDAPRGVEAGGR